MFSLFEQVKYMIDQRRLDRFFNKIESQLRNIKWLKNNNEGNEEDLEGSCYMFYYDSILNDHEKSIIKNKVIDEWEFPRIEFRPLYLPNSKKPGSYCIKIYTKPEPSQL